MLEDLKGFDPDRYELDEMMAIHAFAVIFAGSYASFSIEAPEWLGEQTRKVESAVREHTREANEKELREVELRIEQLRTPDEKRAALKLKAERLKQKLGK